MKKSLMFKVKTEKAKARSRYAHMQIMVHQALLMIKLVNTLLPKWGVIY
jgi:hypothetical protein